MTLSLGIIDMTQVWIAIIATLAFVGAVLQLRALTSQLKIQNSQREIQNKQLALQTQELHRQYDWARKEKSLSYSLSRSRALQEQRKSIDSIFQNFHNTNSPIDKDSLLKALNDNNAYTVIGSVLGNWENLALAIKLGIADDEVAYEMTASVLVNYTEKFQEYISFRRNEQGHAKAYIHLEELYKEWKKRLGPDRSKLLPVSTPIAKM